MFNKGGDGVRTFHILRAAADRGWLAAMAPADGLLLLQDAVFLPPPPRVRAYACAEDARGRGVQTSAELVDYPRIVELIAEYERVIVW